MKTSDVLAIVLVAMVLGYAAYDSFDKKKDADTASAAGFENPREYNNARAAGFSDAKKWRAERERLQAARLKEGEEYERKRNFK